VTRVYHADSIVSYDEDGTWLRAWRDGDRAAGDALVRKHYVAVRRFFEVKATAVADDLTQRTFLACVQAIERLERAASFRAFLFGIARNQLLQHMQQRQLADASVDFEEIAGRSTRASMLVARKLEQQLVLRALAELPDDLAHAIQLYYWEGLEIREIADATDSTPTAVSTRLHRARRRLRELAMRLAHRPELRESIANDIEAVTRSIVLPHGDEPG
jgi:RNA polymerase sigma-70 factor (ECF subfamily)